MKKVDHRFWPFWASNSAVTSLGMFLFIVGGRNGDILNIPIAASFMRIGVK